MRLVLRIALPLAMTAMGAVVMTRGGDVETFIGFSQICFCSWIVARRICEN